MHWSTQAGTSGSVRDPYPACGLIFHRRPLSGLPPHSCGERRIKRWGIAAGTATGAAFGTKSNAKAERKCQNFALVTTLFSGSASPHPLGRGRHSTLPRFSSSPSIPISRACNTPSRLGMRTPRAEHIRGSHALYGPVLGYAWCMGAWGCASVLGQQLCFAVPMYAFRHHREEVIA